MIYLQGIVQGGSVKLPDVIEVTEGARVIIMIPEPVSKNGSKHISTEIESEDLEFVRSCRGRLAKQLQEDDK